METSEQIRARYEDAVDRLIARAREDPYVLAVILLGSLSYDVVWERSDIDICIVLQEGKHTKSGLCLAENDVNIHTILQTRAQFKKTLESAVQSSFIHSMLSKGQIVFSRDETIDRMFEARMKLGERDRAIRLLSAVGGVVWSFVKAQKWLRVKGDVQYSYLWIMKSIDSLATIEAVWNGEIAGREVIHQALRLNPDLFESIYSRLIGAPVSPQVIGAALDRIESYLLERGDVLFAPIYEYLSESDGPRSASEIDEGFAANMSIEGISAVCEWMADQELITRLAVPVRLTERSRVDFEEAAYYFDGDRSR